MIEPTVHTALCHPQLPWGSFESVSQGFHQEGVRVPRKSDTAWFTPRRTAHWPILCSLVFIPVLMCPSCRLWPGNELTNWAVYTAPPPVILLKGLLHKGQAWLRRPKPVPSLHPTTVRQNVLFKRRSGWRMAQQPRPCSKLLWPWNPEGIAKVIQQDTAKWKLKDPTTPQVNFFQ